MKTVVSSDVSYEIILPAIDHVNVRITLDDIKVHVVIMKTDEGIIVDLYNESGEHQQLVNSMLAFFNEFSK